MAASQSEYSQHERDHRAKRDRPKRDALPPGCGIAAGDDVVGLERRGLAFFGVAGLSEPLLGRSTPRRNFHGLFHPQLDLKSNLREDDVGLDALGGILT